MTYLSYLTHKLFFQNSFYTIIIFNFCRASPNKEALHGRHDAHKHHDTMGEVNFVEQFINFKYL